MDVADVDSCAILSEDVFTAPEQWGKYLWHGSAMLETGSGKNLGQTGMRIESQ
jgi:hypothetical protein